jgi:hypothetical protein
MIVEVRTYRIKAGERDRFLAFFARVAVPLQRSKGMGVAGPFVDLEDPDVFVWLRAFPSLEARDRMKHALYEGPEWKGGLEAIAMPMLESYSVVLTSAPPGFVNDLAPKELTQ